MPVFDISVTSQKSNPFSTSAQNELAKELYNLGIFNPQMASQALICLDMMNFEGKEKIVDSIRKNASEFSFQEQIPNDALPESDEGYLTKAYKENLPGKDILRFARKELL